MATNVAYGLEIGRPASTHPVDLQRFRTWLDPLPATSNLRVGGSNPSGRAGTSGSDLSFELILHDMATKTLRAADPAGVRPRNSEAAVTETDREQAARIAALELRVELLENDVRLLTARLRAIEARLAD